MSKNILIISASPRRGGNSDVLCDRFQEGAKDAGHAVEKVFLRDKKIAPCVACEACVPAGVCTIKDDMADMLQKMIAADVLVLATPVYFYSLNAQLKALIDRTVARYTEVRGKELYFIATAAESDPKCTHRTFEALRGFLDCLPESRECGLVNAVGVWKKGEVEGKSFIEEAYSLGLKA